MVVRWVWARLFGGGGGGGGGGAGAPRGSRDAVGGGDGGGGGGGGDAVEVEEEVEEADDNDLRVVRASIKGSFEDFRVTEVGLDGDVARVDRPGLEACRAGGSFANAAKARKKSRRHPVAALRTLDAVVESAEVATMLRALNARARSSSSSSLSAGDLVSEAVVLTGPRVQVEVDPKRWRADFYRALHSELPWLDAEPGPAPGLLVVRRGTALDALRDAVSGGGDDDDGDDDGALAEVNETVLDALEDVHRVATRCDPLHGQSAVLLPPILDRDRRRRVHAALARVGAVRATTTARDGRIEVTPARSNQTKRPHADEGEEELFCYLRFSWEKRGVDHFAALATVAQGLGVERYALGYAGIKDKRAVTTQWLTVRGTTETMARLIGAARDASSCGSIVVGSVGVAEEPLCPGALAANIFEVTLRSLRVDDGENKTADPRLVVERRVLAAAEAGFPNTYGEQRVGRGDAGLGPAIGAALLGERWAEVVELFEAASDSAQRDRLQRSVRKFRLLGRRKNQDDVDGLGLAVRDALAHPVRTFYLHAFQSKLFNAMVHGRGATRWVRPDDLVLVDDDGPRAPESSSTARELLLVPGVDYAASSRHGDCTEAGLSRVVVVLPLPGSGTLEPRGAALAALDATLGRHGFDRQSFLAAARRVKLRGTYRAIHVQPLPLRDEGNRRIVVHRLPDDRGALALKFRLPAGVYATTFLSTILQLDGPDDNHHHHQKSPRNGARESHVSSVS